MTSTTSMRSLSYAFGSFRLDTAEKVLYQRDQPVPLTPKAVETLLALVERHGRLVTKEELLRDVWGFRSLGHTRTLDSHACRLRQKLAVPGGHFVTNVWGVGYRLLDGTEAP